MEAQSFQKTWQTHFDASGRVLVPVELRKELHVEAGTPAYWCRSDGGLILKRFDDVIAEVQQHFCSVGSPDDVWSEELMNRRRAERILSSVVLDASAVIAVIRKERGAENVIPHLYGSVMSSVNAAEVLCQSVLHGDTVEGAQAGFTKLQIAVIPFSLEQAAIMASIYSLTLGGNISFADRACMALGLNLKLPVLTGDHEWSKYELGVNVKLFRCKQTSDAN